MIIYTELINTAFKVNDFIVIRDSFIDRETRTNGFKDLSKDAAKRFSKTSEYRRFRRNLYLRWIRNLLIMAPVTWLYYFAVFNTFSQTINIGIFFLFMIIALFVVFIFTSVIFTPMMINTVNMFDSAFDSNVSSSVILFVSYIMFLMIYFFIFDNGVVDAMYLLDSPSKYKVQSILEMIRTFLAFTSTAYVFKNINPGNVASAKKQKANYNSHTLSTRKIIRNKSYINRRI